MTQSIVLNLLNALYASAAKNLSAREARAVSTQIFLLNHRKVTDTGPGSEGSVCDFSVICWRRVSSGNGSEYSEIRRQKHTEKLQTPALDLKALSVTFL